MTELLVYAPGIRQEHKMVQFSHQCDMLAARYKVDAPHDLIYFEIDDSRKVTVKDINDIFENVGLTPRFVGQIPEILRRGGEVTDKLTN